jgi:hypothetical protein
VTQHSAGHLLIVRRPMYHTATQLHADRINVTGWLFLSSAGQSCDTHSSLTNRSQNLRQVCMCMWTELLQRFVWQPTSEDDCLQPAR